LKIVVDILLAIAVLAAWLGAIGSLRLARPLDRLHCVTFVNVASGAAILLAAWVADGPSARVLKIIWLIVVLLLGGAALTHATGRALIVRRVRP
jgi:multicomponent Na+:H+ antiporter subunit G